MIAAIDYLTETDKAEARKVGIERYQVAQQLNRSQPFGDPGDDKRTFIDCYSALAECAVANYLELPWRSETIQDLSVKPPDVGEKIEVRWTKHQNGCLIGHDTDVNGWFIVLVRGELPHMMLVGWTTTIHMKQEKYQGNPRARSALDYWVPASHLYMMELMLQMRGL